ncbi:MAG: PKD domain-containing protein [Candidatus Bathyarchaeota archaeon]|nr:PKD domain-containing protein [Candidatus Bathyarchaeota archaeon]
MLKRIVSETTIILLLIGIVTSAFLTWKAKAVENLPTVWVKVYRIQEIDSIEGVLEDGADWRYNVRVSDGEKAETKEFKCPSNNDDIVVNHVDSFSDLKNKDVFIRISLYEDDAFGYETADISSTGTSFDCTYHLKTNDFDGDETILEGGYYKTSGDYDGSITTDENDANLWFIISDNYDAPIADAGGDKECYTGDKVNFDGSGSTASSGSSIVKYEWDFENDGIIDAEGEKTSYTYQQKGVVICRLRVTDSIAEWDEDTCLVNVLNRAPIAEFTYFPTDPTVQDVVNFIDASSDSDGHITSWLWYFGNGINSTLQSTSYTFNQKGNHEVTLTVTDNDGAQASITHTIAVCNLPPIACFNCTPTNPRTNTDVQFTDKSTDPEDIPLSACLWDFGDGYTSELQNPTHKFVSKGDYNITLTVWDDENTNNTFSMIISVTEPPPSEITLPIPIWAIALVVTVVLAIGVSAIYIRRRRRTTAT